MGVAAGGALRERQRREVFLGIYTQRDISIAAGGLDTHGGDVFKHLGQQRRYPFDAGDDAGGQVFIGLIVGIFECRHRLPPLLSLSGCSMRRVRDLTLTARLAGPPASACGPAASTVAVCRVGSRRSPLTASELGREGGTIVLSGSLMSRVAPPPAPIPPIGGINIGAPPAPAAAAVGALGAVPLRPATGGGLDST